MPAIDPKTHEPLSDDPAGLDSERGGRLPDDPNLTDAAVNGGNAAESNDLNFYTTLPKGERPTPE